MTFRTLSCACVLAVALVACSGGGETEQRDAERVTPSGELVGEGPVGAVQAVAGKAEAAGSVRTRVEMRTDFGSVVGIQRGAGEYDLAGRAGRLALVASTGEIRQPIEMIVVGPDLYTKYPESSSRWYRSDWTEDDGGGIGQPALVPHYYLEMLGAAGDDDVEAEGTEDVDGVETARYVVDLSFDEVLEGVSDELQGQVGPAANNARLHPFEVWIDGEGLVRRLQFSMTLEGIKPDGGDAPVYATLDLYDYGAPVEVEPPESFEESP